MSTSKGSLTAAVVNPATVSGTVTPAGCDIGVYFGPGHSGAVSGATIKGFTDYGVFNDGGKVTVENSTISQIGDTPFDGAQHGIAIYFLNPQAANASLASSPATGTISGNTVSQYQKGGIVVNGAWSAASVTDNTVTGLGRVPFIAQNGIQFGFGASFTALTGNTVTGNLYTEGYAPPGYVSTGILLYQADVGPHPVGAIASHNHVYGNQANIYYVK